VIYFTRTIQEINNSKYSHTNW